MLTLRQIEVIRAIMMAGTVKGAAEFLGVSAPGISRVMKHTESQLGLRLFSRTHGRYVPTHEAADIFNQVSGVFRSVENLQHSIAALKSGETSTVCLAAVPSIAQHVFPNAIKQLRDDFPDLKLNLNTIKIEEAIDYLLLGKGEMAALSYKLDHPGLVMQPLYAGRLVAVVPTGHPLAAQSVISVHDLAKDVLISIDPDDPYGAILAAPFYQNALPFDLSIQARTGQMVAALVAQGLGVAILDELSLASPAMRDGLAIRPIKEPTTFRAYAAFSAERPRSIFAERMLAHLKAEMGQVTVMRPANRT
ncbi:LysR family transcriptional regulator [Celeribacter marinus]|uniref:LysR-family transcriptional regulator n=1 Tax=Celeribacter marinus TaxID=1397108 RepID=A0A0P0A0F1_9RHOB|nr:LysR family transcriptional regulator [Celeribacter marinus]ALI56180.1 lysR-family transcriptional regulator [Celeribacter marinus]SFK85742.1 DNA-binding transcriptional regulator, LysR family [Celeribacter marinus]